MLIYDCLDVNALGHLTIDGCDTLSLAQRYGTPLFCLSEGEIRGNVRGYMEALQSSYEGPSAVAYASKAFCCKAICRIMNELGAHIDVASGGELHTALSADFPVQRIYFHGNNKTVPEIARAVETGVGRMVVDNMLEMERIATVAEAAGRKVSVLLRVKPGVDAHTHAYIRTGQEDSKFGFALGTGEAMDAVRYGAEHSHIDVRGLHFHLGSQLFETEPYLMASEVALNFMAEVRDTLNITLDELNIGGGFGIRYLPGDAMPRSTPILEATAKHITALCKHHGLPLPLLTIEPGRSVVGPAGITLYTAGAIKDIPGIRTYVTLDGGMADNPRYALYKADYTALVAGRAAAPKNGLVTLAGRCCESGDLIGENMPIQKPETGDIIAVTGTGAYNYAMASNYNRLPRPPVVMCKNGESEVIIRGESYDDLIANDV